METTLWPRSFLSVGLETRASMSLTFIDGRTAGLWSIGMLFSRLMRQILNMVTLLLSSRVSDTRSVSKPKGLWMYIKSEKRSMKMNRHSVPALH
ncbi:Hydroxyquinol 1,2-dioxygenase [Fusarium oxysporum f. sp. albedinis]|nr:Hydroxyquinol 1,2-dioxygenase [Fusarium oxysporum f. sp. albedinis]